ncbi:MAG: hypothetical protein M3Y35_08360 [Actinomycetota bacterium]|nr:hypothetical protein [Actinomycetota bacterium]
MNTHTPAANVQTGSGRARVPAGSGQGGQFAATARAESPSGLTTPTDSDAVTEQLVTMVGFDSQDPGRAQRLLPALPLSRVTELWQDIQTSEQLAMGFEADPSEFALGQDKYPATVPLAGGPDIQELITDEDYRVVEGPDRPGEAWNTGCDWEAIGWEMCERWRSHAHALAAAAVAENDRAVAALRRAS